MIPEGLPALIWILHTEDADLRHIAPITRLDIMEGATSNFHPDGLFSTRIFGMVGSKERDQTYGKIQLGVRIIHPKVYRELLNVKSLYGDILSGARTAKFDPIRKDFVVSIEEDAESGYSFFFRHMNEIELVKNDSLSRSDTVDFLERWRHRWTTINIPVMPAGMRDLEMGDDGRVVKHEINDFYYRILAISKSITPSRDMESPAYDHNRSALQAAVNALFDYIEGIIGGKNGFQRDRWASSRVHEGTRNVLTAMNTSGAHLDSPNVPGYDATVLGVHQTATSMAPLVIHWLRTGFLEQLMNAGEGDVPLIDKDTLKQTWVSLSPTERDSWVTEDGMRGLINSLVNIEARQRPVEIAGHYLKLVYLGEGTFKVFDSIDELPNGFNREHVHPMTLIELLYLCGYNKWAKYFTDVVRYPIESENSTYPSRIYVRSTTIGEMRRELDHNWEPIEGPDGIANEYPKYGLSSFHDSESPHPSRLSGLGADFDGDTGSATSAMSDEALAETEHYLGTREAWVMPSGRPRASVSYDTTDLVIRNLTGRFDHVRQPTEVELKHMKGV
jgi:hypothetical protein